MDESFDDSARAVMDLARQEASAVGADRVHCEHLMLALCQSDSGQVLSAAGLTHERVREMVSLVLRGTAAHSRTTAAGERLALNGHVRLAVKNAARQAAGRGQPRADAFHLLAGTLFVHRDGEQAGAGCAIVALMRHSTDGPEALLRRALAHIDERPGAGEAFPYAGADFTFPQAERLRAWAQRAAVIAVYAAMTVVLYAQTASGRYRAVEVGYLCAALIVLPVLSVAIRQYKLSSRIFAGDAIQASELSQALRRAGVRRLTVALLSAGAGQYGRSLGRSSRAWGEGTIILLTAAREGSPALVRFVTAHEAAHVARGDTMTLAMAWSYLVALSGAFVIADPGWAWVVVPLAIALVLLRWTAEFACDRIAALTTGEICATDFGDSLELTLTSPSHTRARRLRGLLTHPPVRMRRTRIMRQFK